MQEKLVERQELHANVECFTAELQHRAGTARGAD